jgi:putative ABC transport system permease protein
MGKVRLVARLVARDLRRRPGPAVLLVLAITAATATLALGLVLHGVTNQPFQQTKAATNGPDVVAQVGGPSFVTHGPDQGTNPTVPASVVAAQVRQLTRAPGVTGHSGPFPVASAVLRVRGLAVEVDAEGRGEAPASVDQPAVTSGTWVRPGGVVLERTFAGALGVGVGDKVTLDGRPFRVIGTAVTAAAPPYPNMCYQPGGDCVFDDQVSPSLNLAGDGPGQAWVTEPAARSLGSSHAPLVYALNLKLRDPADAIAFAQTHGCSGRSCSGAPGPNGPGPSGLNANAPQLTPWQYLAQTDGQLVLDEQQVLSPGALLAGLLAIASVAVLAGGRMSEQTRRVGLLKAVGGGPGLVAVVMVAENIVLALVAAVAGLAVGWLAAPAITNPGAGLVGTPGAPSLTPSIVAEVVVVALVVAWVATFAPTIRGARTSTVSALDDAAHRPNRHGALIRLSRRLPVPLLLGMRLVARRPRRAVLSAASVAVTVTGIVAVLAFHATANLRTTGGSRGLADPVLQRDEQMLLVLTIVLIALSVLNAICASWATVLDTRRPAALSRALGASPRQVTAGLAAAQVIPAVPGAILGIPLGIALFAAASHTGRVTVPAAGWIAGAVVATLVAVAVLAAIPARVGTRRTVTEVLQAETA